MKFQVSVISLVIGVVFFSSSVYAATELNGLSNKQRLQRLERLISSDVLLQQARTVQLLKEEVSSLREQVEQQDHALESMRQRQRNLYFDVDRRINNAEAGSRNVQTMSVPVPSPNAKTTASQSPVEIAIDVDGKEIYTLAFTLLKEGQYKRSIIAFQGFKEKFPSSKYADNAQYWLGEANYVLRDYKQSLKEFQKLMADYPESEKLSGAHLKIGYVYFELKHWSEAREALQTVSKLYPGKTVAKKAAERLQRMTREGH